MPISTYYSTKYVLKVSRYAEGCPSTDIDNEKYYEVSTL